MKRRPLIADLFCGAGGAAMGLHRAGFEVVGFDIKPQPNYPFRFVQQDALTVDLSGFDAVWASPPCQVFSTTAFIPNRDASAKHKDLVEPVRLRLDASGLPYIIENVMGAPLRPDVVLCGQAFGLRVLRHRQFESNRMLLGTPHQKHDGVISTGRLAAYHTLDKSKYLTVAGHVFRLRDGQVAMGIDWMNRDELAQAIPPAYSQFLGEQLIKYVEVPLVFS